MKKHFNKKNIIIFVGIVALLCFFNSIETKTVRASSTTKADDIAVKIVSVNKRKIKIKITNKGTEDFYYSRSFELKKYTKNKWIKKKFKRGVTFAKTSVIEAHNHVYITIKWKDYFKKKLRKGRYKIKLVKTKTFTVK